jgi:hypothetical protein
VNIYEKLPDAQKRTIGVKLLTQAVQTNQFNPQPWYLLAEQGHVLPIEQFKGPDEDESKRPVEAAERKYWRTLGQFQSELGQGHQ